MKKIKFGGITLDAAAIGIQGNAVLGIRDSGKTYTATYLAEQLFKSGVPFIAFDPIGVWRFLRTPGKGDGIPVVVAGGQAGDLPLTPASAPKIVEAAMQKGVSLVIDLFDINLSKADWRRIVRDCVRLLVHRNKDYGLRHVFLEEAAEFAPQRVLEGDVYAEIEKLARMGGNSRLGYTLINQRAEEVNKAVLELCDNLFLHRQKGKNSLNSLTKWLNLAGATEASTIIQSLPTLPQGECWAWLEGSERPVHAKVPEKSSLHPDRRMTRGEVPLKAAQQVDASAFVSALSEALPAIEQDAKDNDPKLLRAEIARLRKEGAKAGRVEDREEITRLKERVANVERDNAVLERQKDALASTITNITSAIAKALKGIPNEFLFGTHYDGAPFEVLNIGNRKVVYEARQDNPPVYSPPNQTGKAGGQQRYQQSSIPQGCMKPLATLVGVYPSGMTEAQWATAAGYKRTGGTWGTYKGRLRGAGLIEQRDGRFFATEYAVPLVGEVDLMPAPGPDLVQWWTGKLPGTRPLAEALLNEWPNWCDRVRLAGIVGMSSTGGTFGTYLGRLAGANVIERDRERGIRLTDEIMGV